MNKSLLALFMAVVLGGCSWLQKMTPSYKEAQRRADTLQQLQLSTMRFADEYSFRVAEATTRTQASTQDPQERLRLQTWVVRETEAAVLDASGPNTIDCALNLVVLATLSRIVIDDEWPTFGNRIDFLRATHRDLEQGAWQLVKPVLSDAQQKQLRELVVQWREQHPDVRAVQGVQFSRFAAALQPSESSRFSLLGFNPLSSFDPLSSLDPAVREITQTRQLAERSIYYFQRMPNLVSLRTIQVFYELALTPESKNLLASLDRASLVGSAANDLASGLPDLVDRERRAFFENLTSTLNTQSATIGDLSGNLRATLEAGTSTANSLNTLLGSATKLSAMFVSTSPTPPAPPQQSGPPFDIRNYTEAIRALGATSQQLIPLAQQLDSAVPVIRVTAQGIIDNAVRQLLILIVVAILGTLGAALAYRGIVIRLQRHAA